MMRHALEGEINCCESNVVRGHKTNKRQVCERRDKLMMPRCLRVILCVWACACLGATLH